MTPAEEFEFYGRPKNLRIQGPAQRRGPRLSDHIAERDPDADCGRHAPVHIPDTTVLDLPDCGI